MKQVVINGSERVFLIEELMHRLDEYPDGTQVEGLPNKHFENFPFDSLRAFLKPGMCALDCGANIGIFAVMMARAVAPGGIVYAFEPNPAAAYDLKRVLEWNAVSNCRIVEKAVSNQGAAFAGFISICGETLNQASTLCTDVVQSLPEDAPWHKIHVETITIDDFVAAEGISPDAIKIDVEGYEREVLTGAARTLREQGPLLAIEMHRLHHLREMQAALASFGYDVADIWGPLTAPDVSEERLIATGKHIMARKRSGITVPQGG